MQALARRAAAPIFALALFSSAALIFALQPLFGRMVTPLLGGSPAVWNASMAFFQAALLVGYLYAHLLARLKDLRLQAAIHAVVLIAAWLVLPIQVSGALGEPSSEHPALWLIGVLTLSVGAPFAAASATAPLLQSWYARTGRADAHDPYYLYAASNLGSFIGLLAYPALVEPLFALPEQSSGWSFGYVVVALLIVGAAVAAISANGGAPPRPLAEHTPAPTWRTRFYWMAAAAVPSALSLGVTLHITTDVASAPMLWVVPLALYLLTFVIAFARGAEKMSPATLIIHPAAIALLLVCYVNSNNWAVSIAGILTGFFFSALVCHLALSQSRPHADHLTEFYLFVSIGGVLGGAFAAFAAPVIFNNVYEYPLALALACLFRPRGESWKPRLSDATLGAAAMMTLIALAHMRINAIDATIVAGALGAGAALLAAGWGGNEERPPLLRYAFLIVSALYALLLIYIAFNSSTIMQHAPIADGGTRMVMAQPWSAIVIAGAFLTLMFVVHATVQQHEERLLVADLALGAAAPTLLLMMALAALGERVGDDTLTAVGLAMCALAMFLNGARPRVMAVLVLLAFTIFFLDDIRGGRVITQERSFFGVLRTREIAYPTKEGLPPVSMRILLHGTTIHGAQLVGEGVTRTPLTYYNPQTALGEAIMAGLATGETNNVALIGLGAGSTACLTAEQDQLTIFEIDPAVVRLSAEPGGDFTYVPECQPNARIELGDARLQIAEEPDGEFDVIVVDAFSSDAIPAHLLTREAIALYLRKTSERGIVVLHLSNRNLALVSESARVARDLNAPTLYRVSAPVYEQGNPLAIGLAASVMIVARSPEALANLPLYATSNWRVFEAPPGRAWSDAYINLPRALWESMNGNEECRVYPYVERCKTDEEPAPTPADPASQ